MTMLPTEIQDCLFCGKPLNVSVAPYVIRSSFGDYSGFHVLCKEIHDGYRLMKSSHEAYCHLADCPHGPADPFAGVVKI